MWYFIGYWLSWILGKILFRYRVIHRERILEEGGAILAMNHQSYLDPPLGGIACRKPIYYLARKSLLEWPILGPIFPKINVIPVAKDKTDMSALKTVIHLVKEGKRTIIFPEGTRSSDGQLLPAQPGLGLIIAKTLVPVIPMRIFGSHEAFPRGAKRIYLKRITVVVGEPIYFKKEDIPSGRDGYLQISQRVMDAIAALELPK